MNVTAQSGAPLSGFTRHGFKFHGSAGEYFKIWIVNVLLSIITLGIYSAWAKVRRKQYFYSNTEFDGSTFEYTGDPIAILKGRIIAYGTLFIMALASKFMIWLYVVLFFALLAFIPWLIVKSLAFNARNSKWRGISFHFRGYVDGAWGAYYGWPLLGNITLGAMWPYAMMKQHQYVSSNHRLGSTRFEFSENPGKYYLHFLLPILAGLIGYIALIVWMVSQGKSGNGAPPPAFVYVVMAIYPLILAFAVYFQATNVNLLFGQTRVGENRLASTLPFWPLLWIYVSNLLAVVFSLGLATPWAHIRLMKYRLANTFVDAPADSRFDEFHASKEDMPNAISEEVAGAMDFGFDISL